MVALYMHEYVARTSFIYYFVFFISFSNACVWVVSICVRGTVRKTWVNITRNAMMEINLKGGYSLQPSRMEVNDPFSLSQ